MHSKYLIVGSSHAALEAATAIRLIDADGALTLLTRDGHLPYSPTILPYVVSGRSQPDNVVLRNGAYFKDNAIAFVPGATVVALEFEEVELQRQPDARDQDDDEAVHDDLAQHERPVGREDPVQSSSNASGRRVAAVEPLRRPRDVFFEVAAFISAPSPPVIRKVEIMALSEVVRRVSGRPGIEGIEDIGDVA